MNCQALSFEEICAASEDYWFPAVICREGKLYRNRFAVGLLPPVWKLRRFWEQHQKALQEDGIIPAELDGIFYYVAAVSPPSKQWYLLLFLERIFPFCEAFSRYLLQEEQELHRLLLPSLEPLQREEKTKHLDTKIIARIDRLRSDRSLYCRLLTLKQRDWGEKRLCDLASFVRLASEKLKEVRICTEELICPKEVGAQFSPSAFLFVFFNLIQFAELISGQERIRLRLEKKGKNAVLSLSFPDRDSVFDLLFRLLQGEEGEEIFPRALGISPLWCALSVCREETIGIRFQKSEGRGNILLSVPLVKAPTEAFLGAADHKPEFLLDQEFHRIFFFDEHD